MKLLKQIISLSLISVFMMSFSQCASTQKLQDKTPLKIEDVYYQDWVAGVKGGGSGFNIFIPILENANNIMLDSVYFKGKQTKLEYGNNSVFIGRFKTQINKKQDIIMSNEPYAEYGNKVPEISKKIPFNLNDDECIVSYIDDDKVKYFKIVNVLRKASRNFLSAPPKKL